MGNPRPPKLTFETTLSSLHRVRAFWATLCEEIHQPFVLMPTAVNETLIRERLETGYEWEKRLKWMKRQRKVVHWDKVEIRRLSTLAATTARNWLRDELKKSTGIYRVDRRITREIINLESDISDHIDDHIFDMSTANGIRDRQIVIEAMARGYDILASNNVNSIKHDRLRHWIVMGPGKTLGVKTTILAPELAEEALRFAHDQPLEWTADAVIRACVTDPDNREQAFQEIEVFTADFPRRGMGTMLANILVVLNSEAGFENALQSVRRQGISEAGRFDLEREQRIVNALSRRTGIGSPEFVEETVAVMQP